MNKRVVVRGGGDIATGTIWCLASCGFDVLVSEIRKPTAIRRTVSFCEAMYDGSAKVEGIVARRINDISEAEAVWRNGQIPVISDPLLEEALKISPQIFVDAAIAKRNLGTRKDMAPLVIGLGPGFCAGDDVDIVIETNRGHDLGRIISRGTAQPNTAVPGIIMGYGRERVIHSENAGVFISKAEIGDIVHAGDVIAHVADVPVPATIDGVLRGLLRDGLTVPEHFKIADIDPRIGERKNCFTISDKARTIAGSVLTAICIYENKVLQAAAGVRQPADAQDH